MQEEIEEQLWDLLNHFSGKDNGNQKLRNKLLSCSFHGVSIFEWNIYGYGVLQHSGK